MWYDIYFNFLILYGVSLHTKSHLSDMRILYYFPIYFLLLHHAIFNIGQSVKSLILGDINEYIERESTLM